MIELNKVELNHDDRCPCSSGEVYGACCGRFLGEFVASGTLTAPTPECGVSASELASEYSPGHLGVGG